MQQMLEQAEAVLRFSGEVQRRMSEVGVEGIGGDMGLYAKLRSARRGIARVKTLIHQQNKSEAK